MKVKDLRPMVPKSALVPPGWKVESFEELVGVEAYHELFLRVHRRLVPLQVLLERAVLLTRPGMPFDVVNFLEEWESVAVEYRKLVPLGEEKS